MRTLAIDCATEACSVALFDNDQLIAGDWRMLERGHAEHLIPMIAALPDKGRASRIAVALGPGSFTGLRVGLAAARGLGLAWRAKVVGYPTLALVAAMGRAARGEQSISAVMTGGHGEWYVASYDAEGAELSPPCSLDPAEAVHAAERLVAGSQADALVTARGHGEALAILPDARQVMLLRADAFCAPDLLYGRPPDARLPAAASGVAP